MLTVSPGRQDCAWLGHCARWHERRRHCTGRGGAQALTAATSHAGRRALKVDVIHLACPHDAVARHDVPRAPGAPAGFPGGTHGAAVRLGRSRLPGWRTQASALGCLRHQRARRVRAVDDHWVIRDPMAPAAWQGRAWGIDHRRRWAVLAALIWRRLLHARRAWLSRPTHTVRTSQHMAAGFRGYSNIWMRRVSLFEHFDRFSQTME